MTFCFEEINECGNRAVFYCPEKEVSFCVNVSGVFADYGNEPTPEELEAFCERCDNAFCEAFGEGVSWKF